MPQDNGQPADDRLDAYLDGQLSLTERQAFEAELRERSSLRQEAELQQRIDDSLRRLFPTATPTHEIGPLLANVSEIHPRATEAERSSPATSSRALRWAAAIAIATVVAWTIVGWQHFRKIEPAPVFSPEPLAQIYQRTVANGFEPYYECRDDERFQATFLNRQGIALTLAAMPEGTAMMGLSYPGGLSRNTTAILCRVDEQPVMVFVDRAAKDQPEAAITDEPDLHVFREERDGLIFYEVTPFDSRQMIDYLQPVSTDANSAKTNSP